VTDRPFPFNQDESGVGWVMVLCHFVIFLVFSVCRELESPTAGEDGNEGSARGVDPVIGHIHQEFKACMATFQLQTKVVVWKWVLSWQ
jgi:hypothetical protein